MDTKGLAERLTALQKRLDDLASTTKIVISEVVELQAQLAEAEKPELGFIMPKHLDFGPYHYGDHPPVMAVYINMSCGLRDLALFVRGPDGWAEYASKALENGHFTAIRGNLGDVFDDLKESTKPLSHFKADVHGYGFNVAKPDYPIMVAGNWHTLSNAKDISTDLQRLIFTYEQATAKKK